MGPGLKSSSGKLFPAAILREEQPPVFLSAGEWTLRSAVFINFGQYGSRQGAEAASACPNLRIIGIGIGFTCLALCHLGRMVHLS